MMTDVDDDLIVGEVLLEKSIYLNEQGVVVVDLEVVVYERVKWEAELVLDLTH